MRTEIGTYIEANHRVCYMEVKHRSAKIASIEYVLDHERDRVYLKWVEVSPKYRRQGYAKGLLQQLLDVTPASYKVDPMQFCSYEGREFWKRVRPMSSRIIPATHVEKYNRQYGPDRTAPRIETRQKTKSKSAQLT